MFLVFTRMPDESQISAVEISVVLCLVKRVTFVECCYFPSFVEYGVG